MSRRSRFYLWLYRGVLHSWITLLLLSGIYLVVAGSVQNARWVPNSDPILLALFLGMLFGACLAAARWPGWLALVYTLLLAPVFACQAVGQIIPSLNVAFSLPFLGLVDLMNVRLFSFFDRLSGWVSLYQGSQSIRDTGLFVILVCLLVWPVAAWLTWCMRRWQSLLPGLAPMALLIAVNINLSGQDVTYMAIFVALSLLLLARSSHNRQHKDWDRRGLDYPEELGFAWAGPAAVMVLVITLAARAAPLFGTAEGWKAISDLFKPIQQQVDTTAGRIFAQVNPPKVTGVPIPLAETPQLGVIGAPPAQGNDLLFWVSTSDPPPPPPIAGLEGRFSGPQHYWRSEIYATYTGRGWEEAPLAAGAFTPPPLTPTYDPNLRSMVVPAPQGRYVLQQTFEMAAQHGAALFSVGEPVQAESKTYPGESGSPVEVRTTYAGGSTLVQATDSALAGRGGLITAYSVTSFATQVSADQLATAGAGYPADINSTYLQLPTSLPDRVRSLAGRLAASAANPYEVAMRIQNYLRITYAYTLTVLPPPPGRDVADYFLFEAPGGFCSYYATAMAVMLRTQGIPARVAAGFATGQYDYNRKAYAVTNGSAHAWVEVYFPAFGWVEFEPTASQSPFAYAALQQAAAGGATPPPAAAPFSLSPAVTLALFGLVLLGGIALLVLLLRFLGRDGTYGGPSADPGRQAQAHYFTVRRALGRAGLASPTSTTPNEFLTQAAPRLATRKKVSGALQQATTLYEEAAYSPHPPASRAVDSARHAWVGSFWEWLRLVFSKKEKQG